ncbi:MAG TPA: copper chaperone PCu(A)C [Pseudomonadales bacterium]
MRFLLACLLTAITVPVVASDLRIDNAYARASIPGQNTSAAFATLHNDSRQELRLQSLQSDAAGRVELHRHEQLDGMMRMRKVDNFSLPAGASVDLKAQGMHLMLLDLAAPLVAGQTIRIELCFGQQCSSHDFAVTGIADEPQTPAHSHHHH